LKSLFGVSSHSIAFFQDKISSWAKKENITMEVIFNTDVTPTADLVLVSNYALFIRIHKSIDAHCVVFDTPAYLGEIKEMRFLDVLKRKDRSYRFGLTDLNLPRLKRAFKRDGDPIEVTVGKFDIIPDMLERLERSSFLDKYQTFIYSCTNHTNREEYVARILRYVFGDTKSLTLSNLPTRGKTKDYYDTMVSFLDSDTGKKLLVVTRRIKKYKDAGKSVNYAKLVQEYGIVKYELKYLTKLYSSLHGFKEATTIKKMESRIKENIKNKKVEK